MFGRTLLNDMNSRLSAGDYRPVEIRGIRGCGKTTLAVQFAQRFAQTMLFDLSKPYCITMKSPWDALVRKMVDLP